MIKANRFLVAGAAGVLATLVVMSASGTAQTPGARTFTLSELTRSATFRFIDNLAVVQERTRKRLPRGHRDGADASG